MKQIDIGKAYSSLTKLSEMKFPIKKSLIIYEMLDLFKSKTDFCIKEEKKIVESYGGEVKYDGSMLFKGENRVENAEKCYFELEELHNLEIELKFEPIIMYYSEFNEQSIAPIDILNLKGIVSIEEDVNPKQ